MTTTPVARRSLTWRSLVRLALAGDLVLLLAHGVARRDQETLAIAAVMLLGAGLLRWRGGPAGLGLLCLSFANLELWMLPAALSNAAHRAGGGLAGRPRRRPGRDRAPAGPVRGRRRGPPGRALGGRGGRGRAAGRRGGRARPGQAGARWRAGAEPEQHGLPPGDPGRPERPGDRLGGQPRPVLALVHDRPCRGER